MGVCFLRRTGVSVLTSKSGIFVKGRSSYVKGLNL